MEREPLSIRKFAEVCGVSDTEIGRKMTTLGIAGTPQGKGLPTLLSPAEQDQIAQILFIPAAPAQHVEVLGRDLSVYTPAPLATRGTNSELSRHIQQQQLTQALGAFKGNQASFRNALGGSRGKLFSVNGISPLPLASAGGFVLRGGKYELFYSVPASQNYPQVRSN